MNDNQFSLDNTPANIPPAPDPQDSSTLSYYPPLPDAMMQYPSPYPPPQNPQNSQSPQADQALPSSAFQYEQVSQSSAQFPTQPPIQSTYDSTSQGGYYATSQPYSPGVTAPLPPPSQINTNPDNGKAKKRFLIVTAIAVSLALILGGGALFIFKDRIFDKASYQNGIKTSFTIDLPHSDNRRYVEPVSEDKLLLVSTNEKEQTKAYYIRLNRHERVKTKDNEKEKQSATGVNTNTSTTALQKVELPKCEGQSDRPYLMKNGKPTCNQTKPKQINATEIRNLPGKQNSFWDLTAVGKIDDVTIAHTNPKFSPVYVVGFSKDNEVLWAKPFQDAPANVTVFNNKIWVTTSNKAIEFEPATRAEAKKEKIDGTTAIPKTLSSLPNYRAYEKYKKLITNPIESDFNSSHGTDTFYVYGLVNIDKSGIPALVVQKVEDRHGEMGVVIVFGAMPYLYKADTDKIIKSDKHLLDGVGLDWRGYIFASKTGDGLITEMWDTTDVINASPMQYTFYREVDGKIVPVEKDTVKSGNSGKNKYQNKMQEIRWHKASDLEPLKKALGIRENLPGGESSTAGKAKDAIKKVDFENMTLKSTKPLTLVQSQRKDCDENMGMKPFPLQGGKCQLTLKNGSYKSERYDLYQSEIGIYQKHYQDFNGDGYLDALVIYSDQEEGVQVGKSYITTVWLTDPDNPNKPLGYWVHQPWAVENLKITDGSFSYTDRKDGNMAVHFSCRVSGDAKNPKFAIQR